MSVSGERLAARIARMEAKHRRECADVFRLLNETEQALVKADATVREQAAEIERLRETNARLNRRVQTAEAAINELANGTGKGKAKAVAREVWTRCQETHERHCRRAEQAETDLAAARAALGRVEALIGDIEQAANEIPAFGKRDRSDKAGVLELMEEFRAALAGGGEGERDV